MTCHGGHHQLTTSKPAPLNTIHGSQLKRSIPRQSQHRPWSLVSKLLTPVLLAMVQEADAFQTAPYNGNRTALGARTDADFMLDIVPKFFQGATGFVDLDVVIRTLLHHAGEGQAAAACSAGHNGAWGAHEHTCRHGRIADALHMLFHRRQQCGAGHAVLQAAGGDPLCQRAAVAGPAGHPGAVLARGHARTPPRAGAVGRLLGEGLRSAAGELLCQLLFEPPFCEVLVLSVGFPRKAFDVPLTRRSVQLRRECMAGAVLWAANIPGRRRVQWKLRRRRRV